MTIAFILGVIALLLVIEITALKIIKEQRWLHLTLVPWLNNISKIINPEKK